MKIAYFRAKMHATMKEQSMLAEISTLIERGKQQVATQVNSTMTMVYRQVGHRINTEILQQERAAYGQAIVAALAEALTEQYGRSFVVRNLRRMMQFAKVFPDLEIVVPLARQLSWSHFVVLIPIKDADKRLFYAQKAIEVGWGKRMLRKQIEAKIYERGQIANTQLSTTDSEWQHTFIF